MKPKLLVLEVWRLGDLAIAAPFLRLAACHYQVTLLAQPLALSLQRHFWPEVRVVPFTLPWTSFRHKYRLYAWPWRSLLRLGRQLGADRFDVALSTRWDPREHLLLWLIGARQRLGFPKWGSALFLTQSLARLSPLAHRYEDWWVAARALGLSLPARQRLPQPPLRESRRILVHTGAAQPVRVWPLERYQRLVLHLRKRGLEVQVACDANQRAWWLAQGEEPLTPSSIEELLAVLDQSGLFLGNDSGPGHLAALRGLPTFTLFGPQLPEWFAPLHPQAEWIDGKPCPYKQCFDYCRFPVPHCLWDTTEPEVQTRVETFLDHVWGSRGPA